MKREMEAFRKRYGQKFYEIVNEALESGRVESQLAVAAYLTEMAQALYYQRARREREEIEKSVILKSFGLPGLLVGDPKEGNLLTVPEIIPWKGEFQALFRGISIFLKDRTRKPLTSKEVRMLPEIIKENFKRAVQNFSEKDFDVFQYVKVHNEAVKEHHKATCRTASWAGEEKMKERYRYIFANLLTEEEQKVYAALNYHRGTSYVMGDIEAFTGLSSGQVFSVVGKLQEKGFIKREPRTPYRYIEIAYPFLRREDFEEYSVESFWEKGVQEIGWQEALLYNAIRKNATTKTPEGYYRVPFQKSLEEIVREAFNGYYKGASVSSNILRRLAARELIKLERENDYSHKIIVTSSYTEEEVFRNLKGQDRATLKEVMGTEYELGPVEDEIILEREYEEEDKDTCSEDEKYERQELEKEEGEDENYTFSERFGEVVKALKENGIRARISVNFETGDFEVEM